MVRQVWDFAWCILTHRGNYQNNILGLTAFLFSNITLSSYQKTKKCVSAWQIVIKGDHFQTFCYTYHCLTWMWKTSHICKLQFKPKMTFLSRRLHLLWPKFSSVPQIRENWTFSITLPNGIKHVFLAYKQYLKQELRLELHTAIISEVNYMKSE